MVVSVPTTLAVREAEVTVCAFGSAAPVSSGCGPVA
jgi:hypothetical protein